MATKVQDVFSVTKVYNYTYILGFEEILLNMFKFLIFCGSRSVFWIRYELPRSGSGPGTWTWKAKILEPDHTTNQDQAADPTTFQRNSQIIGYFQILKSNYI